jgi:uncharacterized protein (DUF736 family)
MTESKKLEKLGALWKRTSKAGVAYLSGTIGEQKVVVFRTKEKRNDRSPDFQVYKSEPPKPALAPEPVITDEDIPF